MSGVTEFMSAVTFGWREVVGLLSFALALLPLLMTIGNLRRFMPPTSGAVSDPACGGAKPQPISTDKAARPGVSILLPARNEAATLDATVRAALASEGVDVEVVILNDQSTDSTADIAAALAAADPRVRVVDAPPLPEGWAGKQRACHLLAAAARHDVLMFIDCDVRVEPSAAAAAARMLLSVDRLGLVSGFPREVTVSLPEQLVIPWIHVLLLGYLPMARMRASTSPAYAAACGQWMVARADAYRACGGHAAAPLSRYDGITLPRAFRAAGYKTDIFDGTRLARCRMYEDLAGVWHGFGKNAGEGMATPAVLPVWTVLLFGGHVLPWLMVPVGLASGHVVAAIAGAAGVACNLVMRLLLAERLQQPRAVMWLHPVGASMLLAINWGAVFRYLSGRPSTWRGRRYVRS